MASRVRLTRSIFLINRSMVTKLAVYEVIVSDSSDLGEQGEYLNQSSTKGS